MGWVSSSIELLGRIPRGLARVFAAGGRRGSRGRPRARAIGTADSVELPRMEGNLAGATSDQFHIRGCLLDLGQCIKGGGHEAGVAPTAWIWAGSTPRTRTASQETLTGTHSGGQWEGGGRLTVGFLQAPGLWRGATVLGVLRATTTSLPR